MKSDVSASFLRLFGSFPSSQTPSEGLRLSRLSCTSTLAFHPPDSLLESLTSASYLCILAFRLPVPSSGERLLRLPNILDSIQGSAVSAARLRLCCGSPSSRNLPWCLRRSRLSCAFVTAHHPPGSYPGVSDFRCFFVPPFRLPNIPVPILGSATSASSLRAYCGSLNSRAISWGQRLLRPFLAAFRTPGSFCGVCGFRGSLAPNFRLPILPKPFHGKSFFDCTAKRVWNVPGRF